MKCLNCGSIDCNLTSKDFIECTGCFHVNELSYYICVSCGCSYVIHDGNMVDMNKLDTEVLKTVEDLLGLISNMEEAPSQLSDTLHKCIRCNNVCVSTSDNVYECLTCGFKWETQ